MGAHRTGGRRTAGVVLLALPAAGLAGVPAYARREPELLDVPFFYWYQLAWVVLSLLCLAGAALLIPPPDRPSDRPDHHRPGGTP